MIAIIDYDAHYIFKIRIK